MLGAAGLADRFEMINRASVQAALRAREVAGNANVLVAGSAVLQGESESYADNIKSIVATASVARKAQGKES